MRVLVFCLLFFTFGFTSCSKHTTNEFEPVVVDFKKVDWYAKRAQLAYSTEDEIRKALDNVLVVNNIEEYDIQYFIEQLPNQQQLLSVRGTANLKNVREDVEYTKSKNKKIKILVHKGFDEDANVVLSQALPQLDKNQEILLTGHSLGAAVSTLLMIFLHVEGYSVGPSINFGQPKFTNIEGAKKYDFLPLTRVVNKKDVVPLVPPASLVSDIGGEYRHFGQEVIALDGSNFVFLDNHITVEKDLSELWFNLGDLSVEDHMIANYRASIQEKFNQQVEVPFQERDKFLSHD